MIPIKTLEENIGSKTLLTSIPYSCENNSCSVALNFSSHIATLNKTTYGNKLQKEQIQNSTFPSPEYKAENVTQQNFPLIVNNIQKKVFIQSEMRNTPEIQVWPDRCSLGQIN